MLNIQFYTTFTGAKDGEREWVEVNTGEVWTSCTSAVSIGGRAILGDNTSNGQ